MLFPSLIEYNYTLNYLFVRKGGEEEIVKEKEIKGHFYIIYSVICSFNGS